MNKYIKGDVNLSMLYLKEIPEILNGIDIDGSLILSGNGLTTLNNFPELVTEADPAPTMVGVTAIAVFEITPPVISIPLPEV